MIIIIGGIIVASVLVFIIILMIRYKVCNNNGQHKVTKVSNVYSQTNGAQMQGCSIALPQSMSKQAVGHEENAQCCKVASDNVTQCSETCSSQDSSTTTSALPPSWTSSTSVSQKQKRKTGTKPSAEPQSEAVTNVESQNTNRNNSTALQLASQPPDSVTEGPTSKRAHTKPSKFLTVPAERSRRRHRYSLLGAVKESDCYANSPTKGELCLKRSRSMSGLLIQSRSSDGYRGKAILSNSEWMLESAV